MQGVQGGAYLSPELLLLKKGRKERVEKGDVGKGYPAHPAHPCTGSLSAILADRL